MNSALILFSALLLDAFMGEPRWLWQRLPHPAVLMGRMIGWADTRLNKGPAQRFMGIVTLLGMMTGAGVIGLLAAQLGTLVEVLLAAILLAQRSLVDHVAAVARGLRMSVQQGRRDVAMIVSRDTGAMDEAAVARSAIESAAENLSDGVIAPAFWLLIGGLPGMMIYKVVNTADSMIGYRTPRHEAFGWAAARNALIAAARQFWTIPDGCAVLPVPGASAAIAQIPMLAPKGTVHIPGPTYNEHAASFAQAGWKVSDTGGLAEASVHVHPNNPDGRMWSLDDPGGQLRIIDESFCDVLPDQSLIRSAATPGTLVLKSFGKFWGLAGLRLGFVIGDPALVTPLEAKQGPWAVAGPALEIGRVALEDINWAQDTRQRLAADADRLDVLMTGVGATVVGGTTLFRLYDVPNAAGWQHRLARHHIWSRVFPYNARWLRLGLPGPDGWARLACAFT